MYLDDLGIAPDPESTGDGAADAAPEPRGRRWIFDESPFSVDWLHAVDARIDLRADRVVGRESFAAEDLRAVAVLENGKLTVRPFDVGYKGGAISAEAVIDARRDVPEFLLRARVEELRVARVMSQFQSQAELTGIADVTVDLESRGDSPRALAKALRGTLDLTLRDGSIERSYIAFSTAAALKDWFGFSPREGMARLDCLIAAFEIEDGVATARTLVLDSERILVVGRGTIRLDDERYELVLVPRAKKTTVVDVAVPVKISGRLGSPEIRVKKSALGRATADALVDNPVARGAARLLSRLSRRGDSAGPCDAPVDES